MHVLTRVRQEMQAQLDRAQKIKMGRVSMSLKAGNCVRATRLYPCRFLATGGSVSYEKGDQGHQEKRMQQS